MRIVIKIDTAMNRQKLKGRISFHCDQQSADMVCISSRNHSSKESTRNVESAKNMQHV